MVLPRDVSVIQTLVINQAQDRETKLFFFSGLRVDLHLIFLPLGLGRGLFVSIHMDPPKSERCSEKLKNLRGPETSLVLNFTTYGHKKN